MRRVLATLLGAFLACTPFEAEEPQGAELEETPDGGSALQPRLDGAAGPDGMGATGSDFCTNAETLHGDDVVLCDDFDDRDQPERAPWAVVNESGANGALTVGIPPSGTSHALRISYDNGASSHDVALRARLPSTDFGDAQRISLEYKFYPATVELEFARSGSLFRFTSINTFRSPFGVGFWAGHTMARRGDADIDTASDNGHVQPWIRGGRGTWHTAHVVLERTL
ncbi:MAG: hypothetical protein KIT84_33790 [Labilithrix sp.]|nr:hypothetical protein [Labilithrix sp.]MCW5816021.1 hypothetical protein [Labilithrix sp.]